MALVSMTKLLDDARLNHYAVCYCESWNLESFVAVAEAAEELSAPIITGFNGGLLCHPSGRNLKTWLITRVSGCH
jgi:fructose/tagatose bisphosphate aldolase